MGLPSISNIWKAIGAAASAARFSLGSSISSKRISGKHVVIWFDEAKESRLSSLKMPDCSFAFVIKEKSADSFSLILESSAEREIEIATFSSKESAESALRAVRKKVFSPWKKPLIVLGTLILVLLAIPALVPKQGAVLDYRNQSVPQIQQPQAPALSSLPARVGVASENGQPKAAEEKQQEDPNDFASMLKKGR